MNKTLEENINAAEQNARKRDMYIEDKNHIDLEIVDKVENKANELGYGIYKKRNTNQASFTQTINDNWDIIIRSNYLTGAELSFMMSIQSLIEFNVNAIADRETGQFMTITEIANYLQKERSGISRTIQSLIKKGILYEFVNANELKKFNRNISTRTLFVNPEFFYSGDRNKIDGTLTMLANRYDKLEAENILLKWKVWRKPGEKFGKLYRRKTYLNYKNKYK